MLVFALTWTAFVQPPVLRCEPKTLSMKPSQAIQRLREVIRRQHKSLSTEDSYVLWLRRYMGALPNMPNDLPSERKLERFLTNLALSHSVSASTQNQALNFFESPSADLRHPPKGGMAMTCRFALAKRNSF